jgi:hypothetical protein
VSTGSFVWSSVKLPPLESRASALRALPHSVSWGGLVIGSVKVKLVNARLDPGGLRIIQTPDRSRAGAGGACAAAGAGDVNAVAANASRANSAVRMCSS